MHQATASRVLKKNTPTKIPNTFDMVENKPQMKRLLVSLAAWNIEPDVDKMICTPIDKDNIWKTGIEGNH